MAHYMSNDIAVARGDVFGEMAALSQSLGMSVRILSGGHPGEATAGSENSPTRLRRPSMGQFPIDGGGR